MVVHDETQIQAWPQVEIEPSVEKVRERRVSVFAIQSIACCVAVLLTLLLRVAGGEAYESLQWRFQQALTRNEWVTALSMLWNDNPLDNAKKSEGIGAKEETFTDEEVAQLLDSSTVMPAIDPLTSGVMTSAYGERIHPIEGTIEFHTGVDIAAPLGADLVAIYSGVVAEVGENGRLGKYIRLQHDGGLEVLYGHCDEVFVEQGGTVSAGECVAAVGSTGMSTGSHVHIGITRNGHLCDPSAYVSLDKYA